MDFLADRAKTAKYITSVCSGSLLLGAAGLLRRLQGDLALGGARGAKCVRSRTLSDARVVVDRNRISGGGVTAGIDFGLVLLAKLRGDDAAMLTQLAMEYDPQPPFDCGSPKSAGLAIVEKARSYMGAEMEELAAR